MRMVQKPCTSWFIRTCRTYPESPRGSEILAPWIILRTNHDYFLKLTFSHMKLVVDLACDPAAKGRLFKGFWLPKVATSHLISPCWLVTSAGGTSGSDRTMERLGSRQMTKSSTWSGNGNGDVLGERGWIFFSPKRTGWIFFDVKNWVFHHEFIWVFSTWICVCFWEGVFFLRIGILWDHHFPTSILVFPFASERSGWISMGDHCRCTKLFSLQPP